MDKREVANILHEMSMLLELKGENPFKVRAYENAARAVDNMAGAFDALVSEGRLTEVDGIGKNISAHITEIVKTGKLEEFEKLKASIPEGVIRLLSIPGLGPKRARFLWEELGIKTVGELELMCQRHRLAGHPGFGAKMEEKILAGIESIKNFSGQCLYAEGYAEAHSVHEIVKGWPEVIRSEIAGSIRRKKEIIRDVDILVSTDDPAAVMKRFVSLPNVRQVVQQGETKSEIILSSGIQCDLRTVDDVSFPFALHYFTGSKEHNVAMRSLAKKINIKMNEYGLFKGESKKTLKCKDEADIFKVFALDYIEPELRENTGEIEAAARGELPNLVRESDLMGVLHCHTTYSDGANSIEEMACAAKRLGYRYLGIADHSKLVAIAHGMKPADVKRQHKEIDSVNAKLKGFRVLKGVEVDILADGSLDFDDDVLASFDFVIASVHSKFGLPEREMTQRIVRALSNPHVDILAHPTGRLLLSREPYAVDLKAVIDAAASHHKAIEINAHPQRLDLDWRWCKYAKEKGVKIAICPDAHSTDGFDDVIYGVGIARKGWLEKGDILNCLPAEKLVNAFKRKAI